MDRKEYIEKIKDILHGNLVSLVEYNNGDEVQYLTICHHLDLKELDGLKQLKKPPIVFTKEEIDNAIDIFPVEFLNIKRHNMLLSGEDIFSNMQISKKDIRLQLEFEFRSKLVHLRQAYMSSSGKDIDNIILNAVPTLVPIVGALMYLKGESEIFDIGKLTSLYGIDTKVLKEISDIRKGRAKFKKNRSHYIYNLINILTEIGNTIDKIEAT